MLRYNLALFCARPSIICKELGSDPGMRLLVICGQGYIYIAKFSLIDTKLKRWRKEVVGHTVMHSSVLNLHQPKNPLPAKGEEAHMVVEQ